MRHVRIREQRSGLDARMELLDELAPRHAQLLWQLAGSERSHEAIHAMWTGPEISCPIALDEFARDVAGTVDLVALGPENATSFPAAGEVATVLARAC